MAGITNKTGSRIGATPNSITFRIRATFEPTSEECTGSLTLKQSPNTSIGETISESFTSTTTVSGDVTHEGLFSNTSYSYFIAATLKVTATQQTIATNSTGSLSSYTAAEAATIEIGGISDTEVVLNWSTAADGGYRPKNVQYSLDGGTTWVTMATVADGSASSGSFTISGLNPSSQYSIMTRTYNGVSAQGDTLLVTTIASTGFYGSVNDESTLAIDIYGGVNNESQKITKLYGSVNNEARLIHQGFGHLSYN